MNIRPQTGTPHNFAIPQVELETRSGGVFVLRSTASPGQIPRSAPDILDMQAALTPDRPFMRQRVNGNGRWRQISYADMARASRSFAQWLLAQGLKKGDTIAILSGPSIEHVIVIMGAQRVGVGAASLSVNFSLLGKPEDKLGKCMAMIGARYAFADEIAPFETALRWLAGQGVALITGEQALPDLPSWHMDEICATRATAEVDQAFAAIDSGTVARIMFTSGSTGTPKAVALTNGNLMASVAQMDALGFMPRDGADSPQVLDFMPYSHIFAGTAGLNNAIFAGATINIDAGRPIPKLFQQTIVNLHEISPIWFATAPIGYGMLVDAMDEDSALRKNFFRNLRYMLFSGATLPQQVRDRLNRFAEEETGRIVPMTAAYGSTEMLASTFVHWDNDDTSKIGVPAPGVQVKLVPTDDKYEMRVRGPNVMPRDGYIGDSAANAAAFDEEGFFRTGDAGRLVDMADPAKGLRYDGRFGEQFKLTSATYVAAGSLRIRLLEAFDPLLREICVCGENKDYLAAIGWLNEAGVGALFPDMKALSQAEMMEDPRLVDALHARLLSYNEAGVGSSRHMERILLSDVPLSFELNEITDKGSINMRKIWERRSKDIESLFAGATLDQAPAMRPVLIQASRASRS